MEFKDPDQHAMMAAIVTTMLWLPAGALLALIARFALNIPLESFVSFGGILHPGLGLLAWWAILFLPAYLYSLLISS